VIGEVLDLLQDEAVPTEYRDKMREQLRLLAWQARFTIRSSGVSSTAAAA
jgi:hypothetical protein